MLAGGFGTRLRSLVSDVPKPLAPAGDRPFLEHLVEHWVGEGVNDFVFLLHYESKKIETILDEMASCGVLAESRVRIVVETTPLGTGGAILNGIHALNLSESFLVANADTWLGSGVKQLSDVTPCAIGAVNVVNTERYGSIDIRKNVICAFGGKASSTGSGYINSGLYHLHPKVFDRFEVGSNFSLEDHVFPGLVAEGLLSGIVLDVDFIDIGVPDDYVRFCNWIEKGKTYVL